jgi:hypothetical protein
MKSSTLTLSRGMLDTYEELLISQGGPVEEWFRPGLTMREINRTLAPLDLGLPLEALIWWEWHDGPVLPYRTAQPPRWRNCLSLAAAVEQYKKARSVAENTTEPDSPPLNDPDFRWNPTWLPIIGRGLMFVIDCEGGEKVPSPVKMIDWQDQPSDYARIKALSLGEMVGWWIGALENGAWQWDEVSGEWHVDRRLLDEEVRNSPLV